MAYAAVLIKFIVIIYFPYLKQYSEIWDSVKPVQSETVSLIRIHI